MDIEKRSVPLRATLRRLPVSLPLPIKVTGSVAKSTLGVRRKCVRIRVATGNGK